MFDQNEFKTIAMLPSREILLAQIAMMLTMPLKQLMLTINERSKKYKNMEKYKELLDKIGEMKVTELGELVKAMEENSSFRGDAGNGSGRGRSRGSREKNFLGRSFERRAGSQKNQVIKVLKRQPGLGERN